MRWNSTSHRLSRLLVTLLSCCLLCGGATLAQEETSVADQLAEALDHYNALDYDKGLAVTEALLQRTDLTAADSVAVLEVMAIVTYAKGETYLQQAIRYLNKISQIGPCVVPMPRDLWPQELRDTWYGIVKEKNALTCEEPKEGIKTIAIMQFDNYSAGEYQEKLGLISKGLADFFAYDFAKISDFRVIERDKIDYILKEIELQQSGAVDKATAVRVGKILGARYMVFGSITQLDANTARMVVRAVSVETSEIIAQVDREGKPEYSKMEKEAVEELAKKLDVTLGEETLGKLKEGGTESLDATTYYAMGLDHMDKYEYGKAYEYFKMAYDLDSSFTEAKRKMEIYRPLAG
ncbi:MAG: CsgG/HfaB family protein [candidate division Zixibacteria bacterium]|nr:CsgG/HfaB family protein [candidate division Zixibacteria bacterium]